MGVQINTIESRIRFVKKESADVGDGTDFPMLVTLDQLAEIMYRARDAWFTAGSAVYSTATTSVQGTPIAQLVNSINTQDNPFGTVYSYARAYSASDTVSEQFDSYFGEVYTLYGYYNFRDCNNEFGIWYPDYGLLGGNLLPSFSDVGFRCGFSHKIECFTSYFGLDPAPSGFYKITTTEDYSGGSSSVTASNLWVTFTGEVAYVGDSPTSATSQLYVGLKMGVDTGFYGINTSSSYFDVPSYDTGGKFVLGLAGGDSVSCKLYSPDTYDSVSDFVLQAQEWWPYAKSDGTPAWSETTGLPL